MSARKLTGLILSCALIACRRTVVPTQRPEAAARVREQDAPLTYICDNRFRIRNLLSEPATIAWQVVGTEERGTVVLAGRDDVAASIERVVTSHRGALVLRRNGRDIATAPNRGISCLSIAPSVTPRSVWDTLQRPENVLTNPPGITGRVVWNTLYVYFDEDASLAQKEAALAVVDAEVIGGITMGRTPFYHIRLRGARPAPPDSSSGPLLRARAKLEALPFVKRVFFNPLDRLSATSVNRSTLCRLGCLHRSGRRSRRNPRRGTRR